MTPPARCGNSETLTPDHLSRSFETLRNEPLTAKTQLDRLYQQKWNIRRRSSIVVEVVLIAVVIVIKVMHQLRVS